MSGADDSHSTLSPVCVSSPSNNSLVTYKCQRKGLNKLMFTNKEINFVDFICELANGLMSFTSFYRTLVFSTCKNSHYSSSEESFQLYVRMNRAHVCRYVCIMNSYNHYMEQT